MNHTVGEECEYLWKHEFGYYMRAFYAVNVDMIIVVTPNRNSLITIGDPPIYNPHRWRIAYVRHPLRPNSRVGFMLGIDINVETWKQYYHTTCFRGTGHIRHCDPRHILREPGEMLENTRIDSA